MNLARMRELFHKHSSSLSSDFGDGDVDEYLNRAYQGTIPEQVDGEATEGYWEIDVTDAQVTEYPYPVWVIGPKLSSPPYNEGGDYYYSVETDPTVFNRYKINDAGGGTGTILFYGRVAEVRNPQEGVKIIVPAKVGPELPLTDTGLADSNHAMAVITSAATDFLGESDDQVGLMRENNLYKLYLHNMRVRSHSRARSRRWKRSF